MVWTVLIHPDARDELQTLPVTDQTAVDNVMQKLQALGPRLGYPHCSDIRAADQLRELRPRAGRSRWRAFYRRAGEVYVVAAVGPEADVDRRGFGRSVAKAQRRLDQVEATE